MAYLGHASTLATGSTLGPQSLSLSACENFFGPRKGHTCNYGWEEVDDDGSVR